MYYRNKYFFLSNFYPCSINYEGIDYPTVEHAYQAAKSLNGDVRDVISRLISPGQAKRFGKEIKIRDDWDKVKLNIMETLLKLKFNQPFFAKLLLDTRNEQLIEENPWGDRFWGQCNGEGLNHLGKIQMKIRQELIDIDSLHGINK